MLRSEKVPTKDRERWIERNGPDADVIISHPALVETGVDLFDKNGGHNFTTLMFYQTGYSTYTLRQASRRSWRIGQTHLCKIIYYYYEQTMQSRCLSLMGRKMSASLAVEGKFSADGLVAMAGDDMSIEMAMAKSLVDKLDDMDAVREWSKITSTKVGNEGNVTEGRRRSIAVRRTSTAVPQIVGRQTTLDFRSSSFLDDHMQVGDDDQQEPLTAESFFGDPVSVYTADRAIDDGMLVHPYPQKFPNLLLTRSVHDAIDERDDGRTYDQKCIPFCQDVAMVWNDHVRKTKGRDGLYTGDQMAGNVTGHEVWIAANEKDGLTVMFPSDY